MNKHWVQTVGILSVVGGVFYALSLVAGDNSNVADIIKNLVQAFFASAITAMNGNE